MREIKFRGQRTDNGEWVYGWYYQLRINVLEIKHYIVENQLPHFYGVTEIEVIPETVGQYTGRRTDEGTDIYEGDLFRTISGSLVRIMWRGSAFSPYRQQNSKEFNKMTSWTCIYGHEPIGNIHDNPDLLAEVAPCEK